MELSELIETVKPYVTSMEGIAIGAGLGATALTALITNYVQQREADVFPSLFSAVDRFLVDNEAMRFYSAVNDMVMNVTNAWNLSREAKDSYIFNRTIGRSKIRECMRTVEHDGPTLLKNLSTHRDLAKVAEEVSSTLRSSWDYTPSNNYIYVPVTTGTGKNKRTTMKRKYVDTDHYFTFFPDKAIDAQSKLQDMLAEYVPSELYNPNMDAEAAPNMHEIKAINKTVFEDEAKMPYLDELKDIFMQWIKCARADNSVDEVNSVLTYLANESPKMFPVINGSEEKYHFNTTSTSHRGPDGYRNSRTLSKNCTWIADDLNGLQKSINLCMTNAGKLEKLFQGGRDYTREKQERVKPKDIPEESLDLAVETYLSAFPNSKIDIDQRVSHGKTWLIGLGVGVLVGIAAYAAQHFLMEV